MEKGFWEKIQQNFNTIHYTSLLWMLCSLFAILIGLKYYQREKTYHLFLLFCLTSLIITNPISFAIETVFQMNKFGARVYEEVLNTLFALIEATAFFSLLKKKLQIKNINLLVKVLWLILFFLCTFFFLSIATQNITKKQILIFSFYITCVEFFMLLPLCLLYFYQLLFKENKINISLKNSPSFWIISGLFFYCSVSLPFLLLGNKLLSMNQNLYLLLWSIHYISISILLLCIAKAFSCKAPLTT